MKDIVKRKILKNIYFCIAFLAMLVVLLNVMSVKTLCVQFYTSDEVDDFENNLKDRWKDAGYAWDDGTGTNSSKSNEGISATSEKEPVKTCTHEYEDKITKEPTCSEAGEMTSTCTKCGDTYKTELAATGKHEYESVVTKDPTCTEVGELTYTCKVCGDTYTEEIPATGHEYTASVTKAATCTVPGEQIYTCSKCGDTYTEEIPATGHVSGEWTVTKEAGLFTPGERIIKCSVCGDTLTSEAIPSRWPITYLYAAIVVGAVLVIGIIVIIVKKGKIGYEM